MSKLMRSLKKLPAVYYLHNLRNGFWKKGLQVTRGGTKVLLKKIRVKNRGSNNQLAIGAGTTICNCVIHVSGNHNVIRIGSGCSLCGLSLNIEGDNNIIEIGNGTTTTDEVDLSVIEGTKLYIGEDCMLSTKIWITTGDGHSVCDKACTKRCNPSRDITIGNHVWIGTRVIIGKGAKIGDNSIVAAGSVCTASEEMQENVIMAGNPAKIVKGDINWLRERL